MNNETGDIRVLHCITRLIVGGAQENTMLTADLMNKGQVGDGRYRVEIVCGPQTGPEGSLMDEVRERGTPLFVVPELLREVSLIDDFRAMLALTKIMRRGGYHIVHTHSSKAGLLGRAAARLARIPLIVHTVHGWSFHEELSPARRRFYALLEKTGDRLGHAAILVAEKDREIGLAQGIGNAARYAVIRSGIELERFGRPRIPAAGVRRMLGIPENAKVAGSVTRLSPQKAPLDLIEAFGHARRQIPDAWFVVVGDGPLRSVVEERIRRLGLADRVILTGLRRDVPELMAAFDVLVLSSLWEGLPRVLPQAMATGLPVVCTNVGGAEEAIREGWNGFVVVPGRPDLLAARMARLLSDPGLGREMGGRGRQRAGEFGAEKMVREIDALYGTLLAARDLPKR